MTHEFTENYDVIVIGAGHAGVEASLATSRMGCKTLLATINLEMLAFMPCNPSIGGSAKGIVVREIDALGGEMGKNIDKSYIQMRMLNTGKGPAVRALRAQADKALYARNMKHTVEQQENLTLRQSMIDEILVEDGKVIGVRTATNQKYSAQAVIVTTGTALRGEIILGELKYSSGPNNSLASVTLADNLRDLGLEIGRFKTGTPPRVKANSIHYDETEIQPGDKKANHFSFMSKDEDYLKDQIPCWLTYTNQSSHDIINKNLYRAPMFSGIVKGVGPRYCPSIEDKIVRFADKERHQLFLEPEGRDTEEVYVQGLSTSLPEDVQKDLVHSIKGLENAEMMRTGYAIGKGFDISQMSGKPLEERPQRSMEELIHAVLKDQPVRMQIADNLPEGIQAQYIPKQRTVYVRNGMDENTTFHAVNRELSCAALDQHDGNYMRKKVNAQAYCAAYVVGKRYGADVSGFQFGKVAEMQANGQKDPQELRGFLNDVRQAAYTIRNHMERNFGEQEQTFSKDAFSFEEPPKQTPKKEKKEKQPER
mgnify:CR=1 FL=1